MGAETGFASETAVGKPVVELPVQESWRLWAASYDRDPNPLLALEERVAAPVLGSLAGLRVVDLCCGTGRWMTIASALGGEVMGVDLSTEMIRRAGEKQACTGRLAIGDLARLPVESGWADLAICSFGISYTQMLRAAFEEMARVARRAMITDLHPAAARAGWSRSFTTASGTFSVAHHAYSFDDLDAAADATGWSAEGSVEACFGECEREIFLRAGKEHVFDTVSKIPAIFVKTWVRPC